MPTPTESPVQKPGFSCTTECRGAEEGLVGWVRTHPVFRVYHHRRMEDATVPFSFSKGISLTELYCVAQ